MNIEISTSPIPTKKLPHLLKYMGSKREIVDFISDAVKSIDTNTENMCDLFSGTGIVSAALKSNFNVHANDIQKYSYILSNTYLLNSKRKITLEKLSEIHEKAICLTEEFYRKHPELNFVYDSNISLEEFKSLELLQQTLINKEFNIGFHLFSKCYSGTYWSYEQCVWIDSIRAIAEQNVDTPEYYIILSSLIYAMSYTSQSTGHYAQYRDATSQSSMTDILLYRQRKLWPYFEKKFTDLAHYINNEPISGKKHRVTTLDYIDCLRIIEENTIVYADPPYQSVHYSRFYHAIETLVKYDYPKVFHKGRYRDDRHQSPFCIGSTTNKAFAALFKSVEEKKAHLALSYSDTGIISLENLEEISNIIFGKHYEYNLLQKSHTHKTMGRSDNSSQGVIEYLLLFKRI